MTAPEKNSHQANIHAQMLKSATEISEHPVQYLKG